MSQEKSKTMPMQIFGGQKRCIMGFVQVVNPRVFPGAHPLTKKPEDSGYEIGQTYCYTLDCDKVELRTTADQLPSLCHVSVVCSGGQLFTRSG